MSGAAQEADYEEIIVTLRVQGVGAIELNPLYVYDTKQLLLPVPDVFQFLGLKVTPTANLDSISGFIVDENKEYLIDAVNKKISFNGKEYPLDKTQLIKTDMSLYLDYSVFGEIFGLYCTFNFRALSVEVKPDFELPVIREMRLQQFRKNIEHLKGEVEVDTTLGRKYHFLRFGMMEWSVNSTQSKLQRNETRGTLATGVEFLGGETNLLLNYSTYYGFNERSQKYYWRWVNNQSKIVNQVRVGKISPSSIASVYDPVVGVSLTNAKTTYRRSFGEYTISDHTEPGWTVELYVNNVIIDYKTADASGFYSFDVPLVYGTSEVMLKFYGPYGEERTKEEYLNIPFNFLPKGEMEYNLSSGLVLDGEGSKFGRADIKYGINRFLTLGGGFEYLSSITTGDKIPFVSLSAAPFRNLFLTGEYAQGVRSEAIVNYRIPSGIMLELDYARYVEGQEAIRVSYLESRKATLSIPLRFSFLKGYTRMSFRQNVYEMLKYNTATATLSSFLGKVNTNLSVYGNWLEGSEPYLYGNLGLGIKFRHNFTLRPQMQSDLTNKNITSIKADIEKRIARSGYFTIGGEENIRYSYRSINFSFRWDFSFAQISSSARFSQNDFSLTQGAQGSLVFGSENNRILAYNRSTIGRGGVVITPFVDVNHNKERDEGEPIASGLQIKMSGGRSLGELNDSIIRIMGLEPYTSYVLTLNGDGLEQISWKLSNKNIRVYIDPNQFKKIDIPILPMGEVNGWVYLNSGKKEKGQGRVQVNFFNTDGKLVANTVTERDGGFTFLGLPPGKYFAEVDREQLQKLNMESTPVKSEFTIKPLVEGDIVYDIQFVIKRIDE